MDWSQDKWHPDNRRGSLAFGISQGLWPVHAAMVPVLLVVTLRTHRFAFLPFALLFAAVAVYECRMPSRRP